MTYVLIEEDDFASMKISCYGNTLPRPHFADANMKSNPQEAIVGNKSGRLSCDEHRMINEWRRLRYYRPSGGQRYMLILTRKPTTLGAV